MVNLIERGYRYKMEKEFDLSPEEQQEYNDWLSHQQETEYGHYERI